MTTPFDLEKSLAAWRAEFTAANTLRASSLAELETHLRDAYADLRARGLADDEAFLLARRRLGGAELGEEFAKVQTDAVWAERGKWMLLGVLGCDVGWKFLHGSANLMSLLIGDLFHDAFATTIVATLGLVASACLFVFVLMRLVCGHWRLRGMERFALLRRPRALAVLVGCSFLLEQLFASVRLDQATVKFQSDGYRMLVVTPEVLRFMLVALTLLFLVIVPAWRARRAQRTV